MTQFKTGDVVRFRTSFPYAQREALILAVNGPTGNYIAQALPPFSDLWRESPDSGEAMWIPEGTVLMEMGPRVAWNREKKNIMQSEKPS